MATCTNALTELLTKIEPSPELHALTSLIKEAKATLTETAHYQPPIQTPSILNPDVAEKTAPNAHASATTNRYKDELQSIKRHENTTIKISSEEDIDELKAFLENTSDILDQIQNDSTKDLITLIEKTNFTDLSIGHLKDICGSANALLSKNKDNVKLKDFASNFESLITALENRGTTNHLG
jgi:hypothetical protein